MPQFHSYQKRDFDRRSDHPVVSLTQTFSEEK